MAGRLERLFAGRPWWMNVLMAFCAYMTLIYLPFDLFLKPVERDTEVWLGFALHGWAAKATAPVHWAIYAAGMVGFWRMSRWMHPWAALYVASISLGMLIWAATEPSGRVPAWAGLPPFAAFGALALALWRARARFDSPAR